MPRPPAARKVYKKPAAAKRSPATISKAPAFKKISGRGAYKTEKEKKPYAQRLGSILGEGADMLFTKLLGFGDYVHAPWAMDLKQNTLYMGGSPPIVQNSPMGNTIIRHREYLGDVVTGTAGEFKNTSYPLNPGVPSTFPWASQIAHCFEQYKLRGVVFEFKSTSADALNSTNTALGSIIMATEYDATRPSFNSKIQMENHQYAMSAKQSCSMLHPIECAPKESVLEALYVRSGADIGEDLRFTDFANFQIATVGQQASSVTIGELWISYEIEFMKPRFASTEGSGSVYSAHSRGSSSILNTNFFGDTNTTTGNLGLSVFANAFRFPEWINAGHFLIVIVWNGTSASVALPTFTFTNCALETVWYANTASSISNSATTATRLIVAFELNINGPSALVELTSGTGTLPVASTSVDIMVTSFNPLATVSEKVTMLDGHILGEPIPIESFPHLIKDRKVQQAIMESREVKTPVPKELSESVTDNLAKIVEEAKARRALAALTKV